MLLASHFDLIPLSEVITDGIRNLVKNNKMEAFEPYTENMGIFDYETTLMFVNLTDSWIVITLITTSYIVIWIFEMFTKSYP